ncbi:MAG: 2-amino-4-hydroxy-6-hydroxymethyldihydropteridine diphosphokinase [Rhodospirillaceae bacterium]|nr:2-amino-4-hydroxy-6-hydroxymethyldihydropteridine diphosphokinase [Rhodospirillaceae bacterium]
MIFIGLGANLESPRFGSPLATLEAAVGKLDSIRCRVVACSGWYRSAPMPMSDQPWYVNGVARIETELVPVDLLTQLHEIENEFGRERAAPNAARVLDLDLLAYDDRYLDDPAGPIVPHPRLHERAFVLLPLRELAPDWVHPRKGLNIEALIAALPGDQRCQPIDPDIS